MQRRDREKLAELLAGQEGADVRETKKGYIARKKGSERAVVWHRSPTSDAARGVKNLRADTIKAGFEWPFDTERKKAA